ncbi:unnamed protein product [Brassica oleracea var. botrytis]
MVGCYSRLFGFGSRSFSPKIWSVSSAREEEVWFDSPRSSMGLSFRTRVSFGSGWSFLVLVALVGRWFSFSSQSLARGSKGGCLCLLSGLLLCLFTSNPLFPIPWLVHSLEAYVLRLGMCSGLHKVLVVASGKLFSTGVSSLVLKGFKRASGSCVFDYLL